MSKRDEAVALFKKNYGKSPKEAGFPLMDIYEKQNAFLYAVSAEVIQAYKTQQNIIRWLITRFTWICAAVMIIFLTALFSTRNPLHPMCIVSYVLFAFCALLLIILTLKVWWAKPLVKLGKTITFLNYAKAA